MWGNEVIELSYATKVRIIANGWKQTPVEGILLDNKYAGMTKESFACLTELDVDPYGSVLKSYRPYKIASTGIMWRCNHNQKNHLWRTPDWYLYWYHFYNTYDAVITRRRIVIVKSFKIKNTFTNEKNSSNRS